jgi:hypothetical protein
MDNELAKRIVDKARSILLKPKTTYAWEEIVNGVKVMRQDNSVRKMFAVGANTWRGFRRRDKEGIGPSRLFIGYFTQQKNRLLEELNEVTDSDKLDAIEDRICKELRCAFDNTKNFSQEQLRPYNKLRKPVDIYIEHLVCMAREHDQGRAALVPLLFLPLDSQMFKSERPNPEIFTITELKEFGLSRRSTFASVETRETYCGLQAKLKDKANVVKGFHRIYFDLIWGNRWKNWGCNLFETNPFKKAGKSQVSCTAFG